jgi:hypothetical protein
MDFSNPVRTEPSLFHYTNVVGLMGMISNREVWATGSNYLNDPTEVSFAAAVLAGALRARLEGEASDRERAEAALDLLSTYTDPHSPDQDHEDRPFITAFSRSDQSLTLWRLYGGRNGFCIGFDESRLLQWTGHDFPASESNGLAVMESEKFDALQANYHLSANIEDVSYGDLHVAPILAEIMAVPLNLEQPHLHKELLRTAMNRLSSIKHAAFSDEREARLIVREKHHHAVDLDVRASASGALVAYRKVVFPFEAVQSITMAPGANAPQQRRALQALLNRGGRAPYGHVEIRESGLPFVW